MGGQVTPPGNDSSVELLLKVLVSIVQKLSDPIPLFVMAICILVLLAAAIGGGSLVVEVRILFGSLAVLGLVAMLLSQLLPRSTKASESSGGANMWSDSMERFQVLRKRLEVLNPIQFREMIAALLTPPEQDVLSQPVTKGSFLNDMNRWGKLNAVEQYLSQKFSAHLPE